MKEKSESLRVWSRTMYPNVEFPQNLLMDIFTKDIVPDDKKREKMISMITENDVMEVASINGALHTPLLHKIFYEYYINRLSCADIARKNNILATTITKYLNKIVGYFKNSLNVRMLLHESIRQDAIMAKPYKVTRMKISQATVEDLLTSKEITLRIYNLFIENGIHTYSELMARYNEVLNFPRAGDRVKEVMSQLKRKQIIYVEYPNRDICSKCRAKENNFCPYINQSLEPVVEDVYWANHKELYCPSCTALEHLYEFNNSTIK